VQVSGASKVYSGSGAPTISAAAGDYYFRTDTPATPGQQLYVCNGATSWAAASTIGAQPTWWTGTQTAYNAIGTKDANTLYLITGP
jgi:hypothetical protein